MSIDPESPGPPSSASRRWFGARLRLGSRLADLLALALALGSVLAVAEMAVRPFYVPPPRRPAPQVRAGFSPSLGWALVPDPAAYSLNERAPINRHGLRGPEFTDDPEADSTAVRWLLLGGGSTFGVGVAYEDTFGSLAAAAVSADGADSVRVINAGCEGYDLNQCLRFLRAEALPSSRRHRDVRAGGPARHGRARHALHPRPFRRGGHAAEPGPGRAPRPGGRTPARQPPGGVPGHADRGFPAARPPGRERRRGGAGRAGRHPAHRHSERPRRAGHRVGLEYGGRRSARCAQRVRSPRPST
jgi:hypothetical protein